jgi:uncharacterized membrane protein
VLAPLGLALLAKVGLVILTLTRATVDAAQLTAAKIHALSSYVLPFINQIPLLQPPFALEMMPLVVTSAAKSQFVQLTRAFAEPTII